MKRKGIILAGGTGSRLYPITKAVSKQLLPVFDKPMIYYPLSTLMHTGIREVLIITSEKDIDNFKRLLGGGERFGLKLHYIIQEKPSGIAQALIIAKKFLNGEPSCLILGDNLFYGSELSTNLKEANNNFYGATILGYKVNNPKNFG
ncbi:MAG: glucose-1-phosphate thymidylyltransferase, partial [Candidatus Endolissoclinum sp. TMED37]